MIKINQEEYKILKGLDDKWKWIARDSFRSLVYAYEIMPTKSDYHWRRNPNGGIWRIDSDLFQFIQWEDSEPYNIAELIEKYEDSKLEERLDKTGIPASVIERVTSFEEESEGTGGYEMPLDDFLDKLKDGGVDTAKLVIEESEETEVKKDIEWFIEEMDSMHRMRDPDRNPDEWFISKSALLKALEQLDEPETLSYEWIYDNACNNHYVGKPFVYVEDLKKLLVPKQEHLTDTLEDGVYVVKDGKIERGNIATEYTDKETEVKKLDIKRVAVNPTETSFGAEDYISRDEVLKILDQLDEPEVELEE